MVGWGIQKGPTSDHDRIREKKLNRLNNLFYVELQTKKWYSNHYQCHSFSQNIKTLTMDGRSVTAHDDFELQVTGIISNPKLEI